MANQKSMISNSQSKNILPVEDGTDDVELTLRAFEKHTMMNMVVAGDGAEALDYLFSREEKWLR